MGKDLSVEAKQTFQIVAVLATVLVVGIHYKSDIPDLPDPADSTWNELAQEFVFGGVARVAVPLFAFAAGFFYFRSDDGSIASYRDKLSSRTRTVAVPYFLVGSIAMSCWMLLRQMQGNTIRISVGEFLSTWLLHPPAEQLWFLRDLMVLVTIAPLIRWCGQTSIGDQTESSFLFSRRGLLVTFATSLWLFDVHPFPVIAGWNLLQTETLLFFIFGYVAVAHVDWIERAIATPAKVLMLAWVVWCALIVGRIMLRADFDIWYVRVFDWPDLMLHQTSILVGSITLLVTASRMRWKWLCNLSGGSFFVYLIHEFPLRAVLRRISDSMIDHAYSCWMLTPIVLIAGYVSSVYLSRHFPSLIGVLTGGRVPDVSRRMNPLSRALVS